MKKMDIEMLHIYLEQVRLHCELGKQLTSSFEENKTILSKMEEIQSYVTNKIGLQGFMSLCELV